MAKLKKIIILGTGGNSIDILDTLNDINKLSPEPLYECIGFLDDDRSKEDSLYAGVNVLGSLDKASTFEETYFVNGIGNEKNYREKESIIKKTNVSLENFLTLIHPTASVSAMASLGVGMVVLQNVTIASGVKIGNHVIILPNSIVSHDVIIADYTSITGGVCISGGVSIGKSCYVGTNASIIGNVSIGEYSLIGMGSVVLEDVPSQSVFVGNPARFLKKI